MKNSWAQSMIDSIVEGTPKSIPLDQASVKLGMKFKWTEISSSNRTYRVFYVYRIKNVKNKKVYVGLTKDLADRFHSHAKSKIISQKLLGNPKYWTIEILQIVRFKEGVAPRYARKALVAEQRHIYQAIKKYGDKCVNGRFFADHMILSKMRDGSYFNN